VGMSYVESQKKKYAQRVRFRVRETENARIEVGRIFHNGYNMCQRLGNGKQDDLETDDPCSHQLGYGGSRKTWSKGGPSPQGGGRGVK